jgi:hypothetical protein
VHEQLNPLAVHAEIIQALFQNKIRQT